MNKFYIFSLLGFIFFGCVSRETIPLSSEYSGGGNAFVVSFVKETTFRIDKFISKTDIKPYADSYRSDDKASGDVKEKVSKAKDEEAKKAEVKAEEGKAKEEVYKDLEGLGSKEEEPEVVLERALSELYVNEALIKSFIVEFRRRRSSFKLAPNMELSTKAIPLGEISLNSGADNPIDRDFSLAGAEFKDKLIFELRVLGIELTYNKPYEENPGFFSTWAVVVRVQGFLYDVGRGEIIWRSKEIENWSDTSVMAFSSLLDDDNKILRQTFNRVMDYSGKRLAISFFEG